MGLEQSDEHAKKGCILMLSAYLFNVFLHLLPAMVSMNQSNGRH